MKEKVLSYLEERFGISRSHFHAHEFYLASKGRLFLGPRAIPANVDPVSVGILVARVSGSIKPTTNLIQLFGRHASRNKVFLSRDESLCYMRGEDIRAEKSDTTEGYVILEYDGHQLGCGMLKGGSIRNMLPKAKRVAARFL